MTMIKIPAGRVKIGTNSEVGFPTDLEGPAIEVAIPTYSIGETTVTNHEFQLFVAETGYQTDSEKFGWSFVFHAFLTVEQQRQSQKWPAPTGGMQSLELVGNIRRDWSQR